MRLPTEQEQEALRNVSVAARQLAAAMTPPMKRLSEALMQFGKACHGIVGTINARERKSWG
jgi:hypothetical protein